MTCGDSQPSMAAPAEAWWQISVCRQLAACRRFHKAPCEMLKCCMPASSCCLVSAGHCVSHMYSQCCTAVIGCKPAYSNASHVKGLTIAFVQQDPVWPESFCSGASSQNCLPGARPLHFSSSQTSHAHIPTVVEVNSAAVMQYQQPSRQSSGSPAAFMLCNSSRILPW